MAEENIRTFLAVALEEKTLRQISFFIEKIKNKTPGIKYVNGKNIHITLHFFGNLKIEEINKISKTIEPVLKKTEAFKIYLSGVGAFPDFRRPKVIWIGIKDPTLSLIKLHSEVEKELNSLGYFGEKRDFRPHLTIARVKNLSLAENLNKIFSPYISKDFGESLIEKIVLFKSELRPDGPIYSALKEFLLK